MCGTLTLSLSFFLSPSSSCCLALDAHHEQTSAAQLEYSTLESELELKMKLKLETELQVDLPLSLSLSLSGCVCCKWNLCAAMKHFYNNFWRN